MKKVPLTFEELSELNLDRCERCFHPLDEWEPNDWLAGLMGEVGEVAQLLRDAKRGKEIKPSRHCEELADVVIYLDLLASRLGVNLGEAVRAKFNKDCERYEYRGRL